MDFREKPEDKREQKETSVFKILSLEEMKNFVYRNGNGQRADSRFLSKEDGGAFAYFDIREYLSPFVQREKRYFPLIERERKVVALAELQESPCEENVFWIKFVSVDENFQGRGIASELVKGIFQFASERGFSLEPSAYSKKGWEKLKELSLRLALETGVTFKDTDRRI